MQNLVIFNFTVSYATITSLTWYLLSYGVLYGPGGEDSEVVAWVDGTDKTLPQWSVRQICYIL